MEIKEFDNQLMTLAHEIRECRMITDQVTRSCPEHVRRLSQALEKNMMNADLIISQVKAMLSETRYLLEDQYSKANSISK